MEKKPLVILTGPTAVGKTAASIGLAKKINGEIISADSMQVYKKMDIGTAKIMPEEMSGVRHYLVDVLDPGVDFNVTLFKNMAVEAMNEIWSRGRIPILVGGTGFYIQAVLYDIDFTEEESVPGYRESLYKLARTKGNEYIYQLLSQVDYEAAKKIHPNNVKRVVRALEYFHETGQKISEHNETEGAKESPYNFAYFVLNDDRELLYRRIDKRVDVMFENGLVSEVSQLKSEGLSRENVSMQGIGYKEILDYLDGLITLDEAKYIIKRDTRHFAKRQLTWFKREKDVEMIDYRDYDSDVLRMIEAMNQILVKKGIVL